MPLSELDKLLLGEPELKLSELDKLLLGEAPVPYLHREKQTFAIKPEEEPTWWGEAWEKAKGFGEWLFPRGVQDLPGQYGAAIEKGGMAAGEAMTWLVRLLPGNEDLPSYAEQDTARQALTVGQAGSTIALATIAIGQGITTVRGLRNFLRLKKGAEMTRAGALEEAGLKVKETITKPLVGEEAVRAKRVFEFVPKKTAEGVADLPTIFKQLKQSFAQVKVVEKQALTNALDRIILQQLELVKPSITSNIQITDTARMQATKQIVEQVTKFYPVEFSPKVIPTIFEEVQKLIPFAVNQLRTFGEYTQLERGVEKISPEQEIVDTELAKPLDRVSDYGEKYVAPEVETRPTEKLEIAPKAEMRAKEIIGVTSDPSETGYILQDGTMLDFSGRHYASGYKAGKPLPGQPDYLAGQRGVDHREVNIVYPEGIGGTEAMIKFEEEENAIRFGLYGNKDINISLTNAQNITDTQWKALSKIQRDYGATVNYDIYDSKTQNILESGETTSINEVKKSFMKSVPEIAPKAKLPPSIEQEVSMGGGPILGAGMELTAEKPFEIKEKGGLKKAIDNAVKNFSVYTRIKKENPKAYQHFREFKGGQQLALINAKKITYETWGEINKGEAMAIQRAVQIPILANKLPENLREPYTRVKDVLEDRKQRLIDMGKMTVGWPQSYIAKLDKEAEKLLEEMASLKQQGAIAKRQSRIIEIEELKKVLSKREFFPADYLVKPETQPQILKLLPENKWRNSQLRSKFRAGKFVPDIDTAIKWGLQPVDARASFMDYMTWFEEQENTYILYQGLKDIPDAVMKPTKNNPPPQDWKEVIGISELKGYYASPFIEDVLTEFNTRDVRIGLEKAYMEVARWGKMASFYNPIIMGGVYDPQQGYMAAGLRALNPIAYVKSIISVKKEDEFYKQCVAADLFPKPVDLGPEKNMDKLILSVAKQMDKDVPKVTKLIEEWTNGEWNFKGKSNTKKMLDGIKGLYSAEWNLTWGLDAASRMTTVKALLAQGWEFNDAVERARFYHADYGDLPGATRRFANYFMWTPSYQAAMAKVYTNMVAHPIKERGPLLRWIGFWLLVGTGMSMAGYKFDRYRWTKDVKDGMQDVIMMPGPLAWPFKMILRDPVLGAYWQSSVPANIFLSIYKNYDGLGNQIYDPNASEVVQKGQWALFALERFFRPLEGTIRLTDTERKIEDRLLALVAAMKYQRKKPKEKKKPIERWWEK